MVHKYLEVNLTKINDDEDVQPYSQKSMSKIYRLRDRKIRHRNNLCPKAGDVIIVFGISSI